jgi:hypothetical protein
MRASAMTSIVIGVIDHRTDRTFGSRGTPRVDAGVIAGSGRTVVRPPEARRRCADARLGAE